MSEERPVYLNDAATAWPRAPGVVEAVAAALRACPGGDRASGVDRTVSRCRALVAHYLGGVEPDRILLLPSATAGLNCAISGLELPSGALVVTSAAEHTSLLRPLHHAARTRGLELCIVGLDEGSAWRTDELAAALARRPALVALGHASNVTGRIQAVSEWFERAHAVGAVTLLDASQTAGREPLSPRALNADLMVFAGHKGLRGPPGVGVLFVADGVDLAPSVVGGTGIRSESLYQPSEYPLRLEAGTPNTPALAGFAAALEWHAREGLAFEATARERGAELRCCLEATKRLRVLAGSGAVAEYLPIVACTMECWPPEDLAQVLRESFGVVARAGLHCAPLLHRALGTAPHGALRLSPSGATSAADLEHVAAALRQLSQ